MSKTRAIQTQPKLDLGTMSEASVDVKISRQDVALLMTERFMSVARRRLHELADEYQRIDRNLKEIPKRYLPLIKELKKAVGDDIEVKAWLSNDDMRYEEIQKNKPFILLRAFRKGSTDTFVDIREEAQPGDREAYDLHKKMGEMAEKVSRYQLHTHRYEANLLPEFKAYLTEKNLSGSSQGLAVVASIDALVDQAATIHE